MVCLVMALMFMVNPLFYLQSEGSCPFLFKRLGMNDGRRRFRRAEPFATQLPRCLTQRPCGSSRREINDGEYEPETTKDFACCRFTSHE